MRTPIVGIVAWRRGLKTPLGDPEILHALSDAYVDAFTRAGVIPLILPNARPAGEAAAIVERLDGLALSGGADVEPSTYGAANEGSYDTDPAVDSWELALLAEARARKIPTLCICRGNQILNVAHGGTLRQEVLAPGTLHEPLSGKSSTEILSARHPVRFTDDGRLRSVYGAAEMEVNTIHHQAIDRVGQGLRIEAEAPDGVIEAVSVQDPNWWCVGVQWHPERTGGSDAPLFAAFAAAL